MNQRIWVHRVVIIGGGITSAFLILLYIVMTQSPTRFTASVCFGMTALLFVFWIAYAHWRVRKAVGRVTDEISTLPDDLSDKPYDHIEDETKIFFEELFRVKRLLSQKGRMRQELLDIANTVAINMEFNKLLRSLMPKINEATRSSCSAFYAINPSTNKLEIRHSVGFSKNIYSEFDLSLGEGMIGYAATKDEITVYRDIPEDTVYFIRSFLGKIKPRCLMIVPVKSQDQPTGVLVCASIYEYTREDREMIEMIRHYLGIAVNNGVNYEKTKRLTNELNFQNKLIQDQHEEMKKRLDEKTLLLNHMFNYMADDCFYALDTRGIVSAWNKAAEQLFGVVANNAVGRHIARVYEESQWPPITIPLQQAIKNGTYTECFWRNTSQNERLRYEMTITCLSNEQNEPMGALIAVHEEKCEEKHEA